MKFPNFNQEYLHDDKDGVHPKFYPAEWPWSNMKRLFDTSCGETGEQITCLKVIWLMGSNTWP